MSSENTSRRNFLKNAGMVAALPLASPVLDAKALINPGNEALKITDLSLHVVKVNQRGNWYFIELKTNKGLVGLGECSQAVAGTAPGNEVAVRKELNLLFSFLKGSSPFELEAFRQKAFKIADTKIKRTVFSGLEQALWDLNGKALGVPVHTLLGGKLRDKIRVYANINRATNDRDANGKRPVASFQKNAEQALRQGFTALKLAPFDEMRALDKSSPAQIEEDILHGIKCIEGVRSAIGKEIDLLIDVHSHLNLNLSIETARRVEAADLFWFEEPVNPLKYPKETKQIKESIKQTLAGGESVFGRKEYAELINTMALGIIMPDVKHCGGILELKYIAAAAEAAGDIQVAPHNPSGPVATAASVAVCATLPNFCILEYAFGEVPWSNDLVTPKEAFINGYIPVSDKPGLGICLNQGLIKQHV
ncbi:mandelate racemase/muconate lactonizing enzyme family protein [Desertivirga arenae]|uniref:mandelate racemase/muconate lactonizing enzyme family protein n=1 Tax=Desertivirga arenae TaxID=2810309 RepID=UPI001A975547|nr:mandelate racemase/muconate lactonizing enzyme family protein [Pedobacter sp. SYSU D00823]